MLEREREIYTWYRFTIERDRVMRIFSYIVYSSSKALLYSNLWDWRIAIPVDSIQRIGYTTKMFVIVHLQYTFDFYITVIKWCKKTYEVE